MKKILIFEQAKGELDELKRQLEDKGFYVFLTEKENLYKELIYKHKIDFIICDKGNKHRCEEETVRWIKTQNADVIILIITEYASVVGAVQAIKNGADEYLTKSGDFSLLIRKIDEYTAKQDEQERKKTACTQTGANRFSFQLVGSTKTVHSMEKKIEKINSYNATVLITGETGTGKTALAKHIHQLSEKSRKKFVHLDCASLSDSLIESELFGFEKGAFTGAVERKIGKFELAEDGVIFLDEIGLMNKGLQTRLLNVIQERSFYRIGGIKPIPMRARIIAATNENLKEMVEKNQFRSDLYYRLSVINISCSPLRERMEDFAYLLDYFIERFSKRGRLGEISYDAVFYQAMESYPWPGNIRELENTVESILILSEDSCLSIDDIPDKIKLPAVSQETGAEKTSLEHFEAMKIIDTLKANNWNKSQTAKRLGISRRALYYKIKKIEASKLYDSILVSS